MKLGSIPDPFSGEKIVEIIPKLAPFVASPAPLATPPADNSSDRRFIFPSNAGAVEELTRLSRLNYFPGRHLTALQLGAEQRSRVQRLLLRGRSVTHGVVSGLEVSSRDTVKGIELQIQPGQALTQSGTDIVVDHTVQALLTDLRIFDLASKKVSEKTIGETGPLTGSALTAVLVLQPGFAEDADLPLALQTDASRTDFLPGGRVPEDEVYYKTTTTDAARLVLYPLPWTIKIPDPLTVPRWQNSAAWTVFEKEALGEPFPWYNIGAPLALVGIDATGALKWIDRHAVVRPAGRPRQRLLTSAFDLLPPSELARPTIDSRLFNARFDQFCAQLATLQKPAAATTLCRQIPPVGLLPKTYLKLAKSTGTAPVWKPTQTFFPTSYTVDLSVIPLEQLDALLADSLRLDPYDPAQPDAVRLLIPISQQWFDPELLKIEIINPLFDKHISQYRDNRADILAQRYDLANRRRVLELTIDGKSTDYPLTYKDFESKRLEDPEERGTALPKVTPATFISPPPGESDQYETSRSAGATPTYSSKILAGLQNKAGFFIKEFTDEDITEFGDNFNACGLADKNSKTSKEEANAQRSKLKELFGKIKKEAKWLETVSDTGTDDTLDDEKEKPELRRELMAYIEKQIAIQVEENDVANKSTIQELISYFDAKADEADELVESGFLKVRTDVYRLGHLLNNNSLGTKFAASPTLANIVERKPAKADGVAVNAFASQLLANFAPAAVARNSAADTQPVAAAADGMQVRSLLRANVAETSKSSLLSSEVLQNLASEKITVTKKLTDLKDTLKGDSDSTKAALAAIGEVEKSIGFFTSDSFQSTLQETIANTKFTDNYLGNFNLLSQKQIRAIPLERLQPALAPTIRQEIHDGRLEVFERLTRLNIALGDLTTDFVDTPSAPISPLKLSIPIRLRFQTLITRRFDTLKIEQSTTVDSDESKHFSRGVAYADMAQAALRAVEKRIKEYRAFVDTCRLALQQTQALVARLTSELSSVEVALDEARQDVAVAIDLKNEEQARLDAINAHREKILTEHLEFLVFHRPRAIALNAPVPSRVVEPALTSDPVLDCLKTPHAPPHDLATLRDLFQSSPARWFLHAPAWIEKVDRWEHLRALLDRSSRVTFPTFAEPPSVSNGRYTQIIGKLYQIRYASTQKYLAPALTINRALLPSLSWQDLRQTAHRQLTLGHLISAGPAKLAQAAAQELADIFTVATCLHEDFCKVPALTRLVWAERFGQFDNVVVDFRDISRLPGWPKIEFTLRREIQLLVDWLFKRMDASQAEAIDLINDLIRVAMLLASHAPVNQLITGQTIEPITPIKGNLIKIKADPIHIHVGMEIIYKNPAGTNTVRATVEDISSSHIAARVIEAPVVPFKIEQNTTLHFQSILR